MKRACFTVITVVLLFVCTVSAFAEADSELTKGTYYIKSSLSCYINAMGGIEFGAPLLESSQIEVGSDGNKTMTLFFTKSSVTIYSVTCDTFVDVSPSYSTETNGIKSGTLGYYDGNDILNTENIKYTLSEDTAQNAQGEQVHYVDSVSFPVEYKSETYNLSLFVNSNVMGTQFTSDGYPAVLSVDWSSVSPKTTKKNKEKNTSIDEKTTLEVVTESATNSEGTEKKNGMNIYQADEEADSNTENNTYSTYIAYFKEPVLIAVGVIAGAMILVGTILIITEKRRTKT